MLPAGAACGVPCGVRAGGSVAAGPPGDRAYRGVPWPSVGLRGSCGSDPTGPPLLLQRAAGHRGDVGQILPWVAGAMSRSAAGGLPAPAPPRLPRWDFGLLPGGTDNTGMLWLPGASCHAGPQGRPPSSSGGRQRSTPGLGHPTSPRGQAGRPPCSGVASPRGGPIPTSAEGFRLGGGFPRKACPTEQRRRRTGSPTRPPSPPTWGAHPAAPVPCTALSLSG